MGRLSNEEVVLHERYCEALNDIQQRCEDLGLNFRSEMMLLAGQWLEEHEDVTRDDADQAGKTR